MRTQKRSTVELSDLLSDCDNLARRFVVEDRTREFGKFLTFEPNLSRPIHRWYKFKEGFSQELVDRLLTEYRPPSAKTLAFLDPFSGVGTSLLAAEGTLRKLGAKEIRVRGVEVNPYMHFVGKTKLDWQRYDPVFLRRAAAAATNGLALRKKPSIPGLSTIRDARFIDPNDLQRILELRDKVKMVAQGRPEVRPLLLGLAAGAERIFNLRKDGRALRFTPREGGKSVDEEIECAWNDISEDLQLNVERSPADWKLAKGDGRRVDRIFSHEKFDVILFSPPYLNNIDYTEVYKIEQWLLGFLNSSPEMVAQRKRTFRSHPSCIFPDYRDANTEEVVNILGAPFRRLLEYASREENWRRRLFTGYFADMYRTLLASRRLLKQSGRVFLIVGNSVHGTPDRPIPIAVDLWIAKLAKAAGLRVESILVGRLLSRRRMEWNGFRESIIVMSKAT
ncbi:MAG: hypothetical protein WA373_06185 [Burkholderiales bacterium]